MQIFSKPSTEIVLPEPDKAVTIEEPVHTRVTKEDKGDETVIQINTEIIPFPVPPEVPKKRKKRHFVISSREKLLDEINCYTKAANVIKVGVSDTSINSSSSSLVIHRKCKCLHKKGIPEDDKALLWKLIKLECLSTESEETEIVEKIRREREKKPIKGTGKRIKIRTTGKSNYERTIEDDGNIFPKFIYKTTDKITSEEFVTSEDAICIIDRKLKHRCKKEDDVYESIMRKRKLKKPELINEHGLLVTELETHKVWPANIYDEDVDHDLTIGKMKREFFMGDRMIKRYWENAVDNGPHKTALIQSLTADTFAKNMKNAKKKGEAVKKINVDSIYDADYKENTLKITTSEKKLPVELVLNLNEEDKNKTYIQYKSKIHLNKHEEEMKKCVHIPDIRLKTKRNERDEAKKTGRREEEKNLTKTKFVKVKMPCINAGRTLPRKSTLELVISRSSFEDSDAEE
ncbi:uncharacterized protein [Centruroides vittatus]|uniref:uncharacterized protein n=1 Tax=Centruroides vittatus TaxID=120091 RepID=UPI00350F7B6C